MPNKYYLRIEGVNFDSFVLDTNHIKIIRGGSLMLLNSVDWLAEEITNPKLDKITAGASWGLFAFNADNDYRAGQVVAQVRTAFNKDERYKHSTITVATLPAGEAKNYPMTRGRLEALSRWEQMQSPSVAIPGTEGKIRGVCELDTLRPAVEEIQLRREDAEPEAKRKSVSQSVRVRWVEDGREREPKDKEIDRLGFYEKRTNIRDLKFTRNLHDLAEAAKNRNLEPQQNFGNLEGKMAVIYLDGNNFGKLARNYCSSEEKQREFDKTLREKYQNGALKTLLTEIKDGENWKFKGRIRLETLLWGGDEIIWVVPAWKGWWMLGQFFRLTKTWEIDKNVLTHGAGLVFCHNTAPIQPIIRLVKELGDLAKGDRSTNRVAYQILESFDHTGSDLETVRKSRWPLQDKQAMILNGDTMLQAEAAISAIKQTDLPKRKLYRIAKLAFGNPGKAMEQANKTKEGIKELEKLWPEVERCFGSDLSAWLHLLELWDYVGLEQGGRS